MVYRDISFIWCWRAPYFLTKFVLRNCHHAARLVGTEISSLSSKAWVFLASYGKSCAAKQQHKATKHSDRSTRRKSCYVLELDRPTGANHRCTSTLHLPNHPKPTSSLPRRRHQCLSKMQKVQGSRVRWPHGSGRELRGVLQGSEILALQLGKGMLVLGHSASARPGRRRCQGPGLQWMRQGLRDRGLRIEPELVDPRR